MTSVNSNYFRRLINLHLIRVSKISASCKLDVFIPSSKENIVVLNFDKSENVQSKPALKEVDTKLIRS